MALTVEELVKAGYDRATAEALVKANGGEQQGGSSLPFPVLKINYDKEDILSERGIKKGELISGWKIDRKTLSVEEEGKVLKQPVDVIIIGSVYQYSLFDISVNSNVIETNIFYDPFSAKDQIDRKSGLTIAELKEQGKKPKFNNILLMLVREKDSEKWEPYVFYLHGTNYNYFNRQLEELGIDRKDLFMYKFTFKTKKVPTKHAPAWVFEIVSAERRSIENIKELAKETSEAIKKFDAWIENFNSGVKSNSASSDVKSEEEQSVDDEDDIEISFDD